MTIQIQAGGLTDFCAEFFEHVGCVEGGNQPDELSPMRSAAKAIMSRRQRQRTHGARRGGCLSLTSVTSPLDSCLEYGDRAVSVSRRGASQR